MSCETKKKRHLAENANGKRRLWVVRGSHRSPVEALQGDGVHAPRRRHGRRILVRCRRRRSNLLRLGLRWPVRCQSYHEAEQERERQSEARAEVRQRVAVEWRRRRLLQRRRRSPLRVHATNPRGIRLAATHLSLFLMLSRTLRVSK